MNFRVLVAVFLLVTVCNAYNVLVLGPMGGKSHFLYISSFVRALLDRGHEVTYLTSNSLSKLNLANYTEILVDPPFDIFTDGITQDQLIEQSGGSPFSSVNILSFLPMVLNEYALKNPNVQKFIKSTGLHFDVIVAEEFFSPSFLMFAHKHKAPVVTICPFGLTDFIDRQQGLLSPPSIVPHWTLPYSDKMSFTERWFNTIMGIYDLIMRHAVHLPSERTLANKYFANLAPLPPLDDILKNISVVLTNSHRAITPPRPSMPNVISIGGAHIKPAKPLPSDLKAFLDGAEHGAIYFSFGSNLNSTQLSKQLLSTFIDSFKNMKQRVLWKYEDESRADLPSNVMVRKWMPQNDILAHPNVILFISHGGLFGTTESIYHGVPLLFIPFFGDQFRNAKLVTSAGYGKYIGHEDVTTETLSEALNDLIHDKSYLNKARETSAVFKDNIVNLMDEAMFWIEHVAKFKGAKHFKSHAAHMSLFSYLLLDVILSNLLIGFVVILVLRILIKKLFCRKNTQKVSEKKKQK